MMKLLSACLVLIFALAAPSFGGVGIDDDALGTSLGGWKKRDKQAAEYPLSGSTYRTYKPEVSPTPEGGVFVSLRIDHVRGWLSSDDHAVLELTVDSKGAIVSAQSTIAIQGRSISSDLIVGMNESGKKLVGPDQAVQIGTDLIANLSAKLLREKVVEAGRVSFPAALRHNYNLLYQAIRTGEEPKPETPVVAPAVAPASPPVKEAGGVVPAPSVPPLPPTPEKPKDPKAPANKPLEIKPYGGS